MEEESITVNVNAIRFAGSNGAPETVLDYMYREIERAGMSAERKNKIRQVMFFTTKSLVGAKSFAQLPPEEQAKWLKND
jgi:hypothetical protein